MIRYISLLLFIGLAWGKNTQPEVIPEKAYWLLSNIENIKELDLQQYKLLKTELDNMSRDYKKELLSDNFYQVTTTKIIHTPLPMNNNQKDAYLSVLLSMDNPTEAEAAWVKSQYTNYETREAIESSNKIIPINKVLMVKQPEWNNIVKYLGGYSTLIKHNISKDDSKKFSITKVFDEIELTGLNTCLGHIKILGNKDYGFKYHKVEKTKYIYDGSFEIDAIDFSTIYNMVNGADINKNNLGPMIKFKFYNMSKLNTVMNISVINSESISMAKPYYKIMVQMVNDIVTDEDFELLPSIKEINNSINLEEQKTNNEILCKEIVRYYGGCTESDIMKKGKFHKFYKKMAIYHNITGFNILDTIKRCDCNN
jgi:hypothetical protein